MGTVVWYENPAWYAIAISSLSIISLAVSIIALRNSRRSARASVEQSFIRQRNEINEAFMRHSVRGPFAAHLGISDEQLKHYIPKAGLLFLQINLLEDVYQHRDVINKKTLNSYKTWATKIVKPWIQGDDHLRKTLMLAYATDDLMDPQFVNWLKGVIPLH